MTQYPPSPESLTPFLISPGRHSPAQNGAVPRHVSASDAVHGTRPRTSAPTTTRAAVIHWRNPIIASASRSQQAGIFKQSDRSVRKGSILHQILHEDTIFPASTPSKTTNLMDLTRVAIRRIQPLTLESGASQ
ncbi:hypothetical protein [Methylobacterium sp. MA0201]|uniref:hypothetical protein n=1 Tax=Methylobacterium alsaeris TaxID=3344826 RepID=UPI003756C298